VGASTTVLSSEEIAVLLDLMKKEIEISRLRM